MFLEHREWKKFATTPPNLICCQRGSTQAKQKLGNKMHLKELTSYNPCMCQPRSIQCWAGRAASLQTLASKTKIQCVICKHFFSFPLNRLLVRSSTNIKYIFDNVLLSDFLLNKTISNMYLILVDELCLTDFYKTKTLSLLEPMISFIRALSILNIWFWNPWPFWNYWKLWMLMNVWFSESLESLLKPLKALKIFCLEALQFSWTLKKLKFLISIISFTHFIGRLFL